MRRFLILLLLILFLMLSVLPVPVMAVTEENMVAGQISELDMTSVDNFVNQLDSEITGVMPEFNFRDIVYGIVSQDVDWKPVDLFNYSLSYIFQEVVANFSLLGKLVVLAIICVVLQNLVSAFEKGTTSQLTYMVTYLVLITIALGSFGMAVQIGRDVVDSMVTLMQALLPVMLTLLVAVGGITSAAILHPVIFATITAIGTVIKNVILPLIFFAAVLDIISNLSPKFQVSRLGGLIKTIAMSGLGILTTVFLGVLALQGVAGAVGDSVALRTAKYASSAFIPVVGGMFSNALEAVIGSSLLLKNAVGIGGLVAICLMLVVPLIKIISLAFVYKLAGALVQPVGENQLGDCLNGLGNSLVLIFGVVATVGLQFFFAVTIVLALGNFTVMLR